MWKNGVGVIVCHECDDNVSLMPYAETLCAVTLSMHPKVTASACRAV
jgi:hypothetical protein